jgi:type II secretory pathway pseudopilin PulG
MDAIIELFFAIVVGLVRAVLGLIELFVEFVSLCCEVMTGARHRAKQQPASAEMTVASAEETTSSSATVSPESAISTIETPDRPFPTQAQWRLLTAGSVILMGILLMAYVQSLRRQDQKRREEATELALEQAANRVVETFKQDRKVAPVPGILAEKDGWNNPLELFVDDFEVGYLLVVRSKGPDGQSGTIDDELTIKTVQNDPAEAAKDVFERGVEVFKKKFGRKAD